MKQLVLFIIAILLVTPIASADSSWNPIEIGTGMISNGIINSFRQLADEIMELICGTPDECEEDDGEHNSVTTMIINFASWGVKPFTYPSIVSMMGVSFAVGSGILITYIFCGGGYTAIAGGAANYWKNAMCGILLMSFAPLFIWIVLLFAKVLKTMMMGSIATSISPSIETCVVLYFMMALMWLLVAIFFGISNIVICLTAALSFVIGGLYASKKTRHVATWAIDYFVTMVLMQVMVIVIAVIVVGFVTSVKTNGNTFIMNPGTEVLIYSGMILIILAMCIVMTFGKALVLKTAKRAIKLAVI